MGAPEEGIQGWWEQLAASNVGQQFWQLHPWLKDRCPADLKFHLPLMVFDDAGPHLGCGVGKGDQAANFVVFDQPGRAGQVLAADHG
eukprot:10750322-Lingulodinium_polyedra.AAC.1